MGELRRLILAQAILLGGQCLLYFGVEALEGPPHNVERGIDRRIPFAPAWVYIYVLWFPLIALFPLALYFASPLHYGRYMTAMAADIVLSLICYLAYPTTFRRPVPPMSATGLVMRLVYRGSYKGLNCAPSMHCSMCYIVLAMALVSPGLPLPVRGIAVILSALIVLSTLYTKQHVLIDALSALPLAALCWGLGRLFPFAVLGEWIARS